MKFPRRHFLHIAAGAAAISAAPYMARGQAYPSRPITMIVPFPAGEPGNSVRLCENRVNCGLQGNAAAGLSAATVIVPFGLAAKKSWRFTRKAGTCG
jgi:hypothetical protein